MNSAILISLLLLPSLLIIHEAQGMELITRKESSTVSHELKEEGVVEEVNSLWKSKHFSGRSRKLMNTSPIIPTTATIAKNENEEKKEKSAKKEKEEEEVSINSSLSTPGILDLAGMDYSQARRKPPIHN